jgi:RecA/RadA recombinase
VHKGFVTGRYYYLVGDTKSGKTWLSLTCFAEACRNRHFAKHRLIFDDVEGGALMDIERYFGAKALARMEPPNSDEEGIPQPSTTIDDFYYNVDDAIQTNEPFIYVLDSMDALSSKAERNKFAEQKAAHRRGKPPVGSYTDGKAKSNSSGIRQLLPELRATDSILIVISQTRDNIGFGFEKRTRAGGRALSFYATLEIWSSCGKFMKRTVRGKPRKVGVNCILHVRKNRETGRDRTVTVPIYYDRGIDDTLSCILWLIEEKHWQAREKGTTITAPEFGYKGSIGGLARLIEDNEQETQLRDIVQQVWDEIEAACASNRKPRYK